MEKEYFDTNLPDGSTPDSTIVVDKQLLQLTCKTTRARPALDLLWYHRKSTEPFTQILTGFTQVQTENEMDSATYDTINMLSYNVDRCYDQGEIKCETTGQSVFPSDIDTITMDVYCKFSYVKYFLKCYHKSGGGGRYSPIWPNGDVPL